MNNPDGSDPGMSRRRALVVGVLCLWGPIYTVGFFTIVVISATNKGGLPVPFGVVAALHVFTMLVLGVLLAICVRDAYSNPLIPDGRRPTGVLGGHPVFWEHHLAAHLLVAIRATEDGAPLIVRSMEQGSALDVRVMS
jgi:hypothetical protein